MQCNDVPCISQHKRSVTFSMFALGNSLFACGVCGTRSRLRRLAVRRKLEDGRYRRRWRRSHAHWCCWRWPAYTPHWYANWTPTWSSDLYRRSWNWAIPVVVLTTVVATTATLSSNSCKSTIVFVYILLLFCGNSYNDTFLREANSYKRALALRNLRMDSHKLTWTEAVKLAQNRPLWRPLATSGTMQL